MNPKYVTLLRILDQIRNEAPDEFKKYRPDPADSEKLIQARALAFIHLYLLVKCGITDFKR